ncbi:MAG: exopolysaccharide biosynthesis protein [Verrucomicrobia bacterium]|nr:exopolysaccharide biosynthesis protein [Verrucomicrobiota bacterium]NBU10074.1 exopolysaccharide biosynthesis protein [Pseudomonadota bacterium]NDA67642.1 exopolysaccharide biosynthesis protein [Verrucomicrobiota bacterium]NDD39479.1 exopolysaccharide biosynthesis protein [Verrucomicrobiota bacterium]NDE99433.1 exopolysaccharide biosynthesis protein [Verrucomicrobiota bacterium]
MPIEPVIAVNPVAAAVVLPRVLKRTLSSQLARLAAGFADRPVRLGELTDVLQLRGYNALLLFLAFPFITPIPLPGFSTPFGLVIALLGVRMVLGQKPWLPERITARELPARLLPKLLLVTSRALGRLEKLLKPRLFYPEYPAAFQRASGAVIVICGLLLLLPLPVPFSNAFPAFTIILLAAAGLERDGAVFIAGCVQFIFCLGFFAALCLGGSEVWQRIIN